VDDDGPQAMLADGGEPEVDVPQEQGDAAAAEDEAAPAGDAADEEVAGDDGEAPVKTAEAEPAPDAAEPPPPEAPAEMEYPDWWRDGTDAELERAEAGSPEGVPVAARAEEGPATLDEAARERLAAALCGPLAEDASEDARTQRRETVGVFEDAVSRTVERIIDERAAQSERLDEAKQTAAAKVQAGWDQLWQTAPDLAAFRAKAEEQDIMEIAELELVRRGFGDARAQVDPLKLAAITQAQMTEVIRATQERARRLLLGRAPTPVAQLPEGAEVVQTETTGATVARSEGFAERPAAQTPPGTEPRPSPEAGDVADFVEGLKIASPPV
jgi:hypothetical protein